MTTKAELIREMDKEQGKLKRVNTNLQDLVATHVASLENKEARILLLADEVIKSENECDDIRKGKDIYIEDLAEKHGQELAALNDVLSAQRDRIEFLAARVNKTTNALVAAHNSGTAILGLLNT